MSGDREGDVSRAFVAIAGSLATGHEVTDLLDELTRDCTRLLAIASAGLLLADRGGALHVLAASSGHTWELELLQLQRTEGPCLECFSGGTPIRVPDLAGAEQRWP